MRAVIQSVSNRVRTHHNIDNLFNESWINAFNAVCFIMAAFS